MEAPVEVIASTEVHDNDEDLPTSKPALTPPTSEDMDKRERSSSELSELEDDDADEDIEPDHYFEGGKIPVFKPTMDQFRSFRKFVDKIDKYGMKSGIVKVIPPKEWRDSLPPLDEAVKSIKVKNPITQEFAGQHGIYTQANIEKQRSYNLPEWKALTMEHHHQPPAKRGERRRAQETNTKIRVTRTTQESNPSPSAPVNKPKRGPGRPRKRPLKQTKEDSEKDAESARKLRVPPTPTSPVNTPGDDSYTTKKLKTEVPEQNDVMLTKPRGRQPKSISSRRRNNRNEVADVVDEEAFKDFDYRLANVDDYTPERCHELEENYWRTINYGQPMYGADMPGSLFDDRTQQWNVAKLDNLLDILGTKVPGVNTAYLYLGMWKATFAWHLEDVDLYSINYIHFGAPKQWYSISQEDARRFEAAMKNIWPRDAKNCDQFLRHKTYLISPAQLEKQYNIKVNRLVHYEGEFVITYPYGYHSGYNLGYNCAESVNFANEAWLNYGRIAKRCECESDSVWVDVSEIERKLRGEPTPEYYEETDDEEEDFDDPQHDLPSPPASLAGKPKAPTRKRKRDTHKEGNGQKIKRIRIRIKGPSKEPPCILCPNDVEFDQLLPTDNGLKAHRLCAEYTPETYISEKPTETICNVAHIDKARLELKCNYCRSKRGAVFQCSAKKCTRAFHATCAPAAGIQVDIGPMPTFDEEGTEYYYDGYDFRCRFHRPKKRNAKTVDGDTLENEKLIQDYAKTIKPKDVVQVQYLYTDQSQIFAGTVVENRPTEWTVIIDVLPDGDRVEVEWKYLLHLDPADSQRPKPSANAKPLPVHLKDNDPSLNIMNRTDGVPEMGDPFHDPNSGHKWTEFNTAPEVHHPNQANVDLSKENQLWYYLGKTSTEARAQYTEDLRKPKHNTKSNFLDTVKPAPHPPPPSERRSYPASYPSKASSSSTQSQNRALDKPYQYKPKTDPFRRTQPSYNYPSDQYRYPAQPPAAQQPNGPIPYDSTATSPQYGYPFSNGHRQPPQYHSHYSPSYSQPVSTRPSLPDPRTDQYARSSQSQYHSYYQTAPPHTPRHSPPQSSTYHHHSPSLQTPQSHHPPTPQSQPPPPRSVAPIANMISSTAGSSNQSSSIPDGGFAPEWMPVQPASSRPPSRPDFYRSPQVGLGLNFGSAGTPTSQGSIALPRPSLHFQTPQQFQMDVARAPQQPPDMMPRFESLIHSLKSGSPTSPTALPATLHHQQRGSSYGVKVGEVGGGPMMEPPQRPIPSPLSDASRSPKRPEYSPLSDTGQPVTMRPTLPPLPPPPPAETWRYS